MLLYNIRMRDYRKLSISMYSQIDIYVYINRNPVNYIGLISSMFPNRQKTSKYAERNISPHVFHKEN